MTQRNRGMQGDSHERLMENGRFMGIAGGIVS